jgi:hypothetical protein
MPVTITQDPEKEVATEVIATSIQTIADAMKRIKAGRLNDSAIIQLIHAACKPKVPRDHVVIVFRALNELERTWLKPKA